MTIKSPSKCFIQVEPMTIWRNDLKETQRMTIYPPGNQSATGYQAWNIVLEPGEELELPQRYDQVVQTIKEDTMGKHIVGGLAPRLTNTTRKGVKPVLAECLDVEAQQRKWHLNQVVKVNMEKAAMEETLKLIMEQEKVK